MRFIHTGDIHLGMKPDKGSPWSEARSQEIWNSFSDIIQICKEDNIQLLLIAGDMFHAQPLLRELKEVAAFFASIPQTHVVIIAGNHDYISGLSKYTAFSWPTNVVFFDKESIESIYFDDINTRIYGLSFHHREIHQPLLNQAKPQSDSEINILLCHGGEPGTLPIDFKLLSQASFDYVALGHIHKPQMLSERLCYCGSLEPLNKNETGEHGFILGSITKTNSSTVSTIDTQFIPHASRKYSKITLPVDSNSTIFSIKSSIQSIIAEEGNDNIYTITLIGQRDPDIDFMSGKKELLALGNITELIDKSIPVFEYHAISVDNRGNLIGLYIDTIEKEKIDSQVKEKALYYGIAALLDKL